MYKIKHTKHNLNDSSTRTEKRKISLFWYLVFGRLFFQIVFFLLLSLLLFDADCFFFCYCIWHCLQFNSNLLGCIYSMYYVYTIYSQFAKEYYYIWKIEDMQKKSLIWNKHNGDNNIIYEIVINISNCDPKKILMLFSAIFSKMNLECM